MLVYRSGAGAALYPIILAGMCVLSPPLSMMRGRGVVRGGGGDGVGGGGAGGRAGRSDGRPRGLS